MKLKCPNCGHVWKTRTDKIPQQCPRCHYPTYYYKPEEIKNEEEK